jgi:uncharacterized protein (DUF1778 family)
MARLPALRETNINLRTSAADKALIDQAAEVLGQSRSGFMLSASVQRARETLADRTRFVLDPEQFREFLAVLDAPLPEANIKALRALMSRKPIWEK